MARRRNALATRTRVIKMPGRTRIVRVARSARRAGKRALPTLAVAIGGAAVGYLDGRGTFDDLPQIGGLTHMGTVGLIGWAATRFVKDPRVRAAGLAALAAAMYDWGRAQGLESESEGGSRRVQD